MGTQITCNLPAALVLEGNLATNWKTFHQAFTIFLSASGLATQDDPRKIAILLNVIGEDGIKIYNTFNLAATATLEDVLTKLKAYCEPKKNVLHSRYVFTKRTQQEGEAFDTFLTDLKTLVKACEYQDEDSALRDKLVFSPLDQSVRAKLIKKGNPDLADVINAFR